MRILVGIPAWGRPELLAECLSSVAVQWCSPQSPLHSIIVGYSPEDPHFDEVDGVVREWADYSIITANEPLGEKWNAIMRNALDIKGWTHFLSLGSDDILAPGFLSTFPADKPAWGWTDCYFYYEGVLYHWAGYGARRDESIGAGRLISREVCERHPRMWQPKNRGLDASMTAVLKGGGITIEHAPMDKEAFLVDVKDSLSITDFNKYDKASITPVHTPEWLAEHLAKVPGQKR